MIRPSPSDHSPYHASIIQHVPSDDPIEALRSELSTTLPFLAALSDERAEIVHPPFAWSTKQVLGHVIDAERIFTYRALRIARQDSTPLPGFEENDYARTGEFHSRSLKSLAAEYQAVRQSTLALFEGLNETAWDRRGLVNGSPITVRSLAFIAAGHAQHHVAILRNRFATST